MGFKTKWNRFWTLRNTEGGFTLVELVVVIAILAILAGVAVPAYNGYIKRAREANDQLLIAAVNEAFAGACLEAGIEIPAVEDAKVSVAEQKVFGVSSVTTTPATTDAQMNTVCDTFALLFEGNFATPFVTENVKSLYWDKEESSFKMDHENGVPARIFLSSGKSVTVSAADMEKIQASTYADMGYEGVKDLIEDVGESGETLANICAIGTIQKPSFLGGGYTGLMPKITNALKAYDVIDANKEKEMLNNLHLGSKASAEDKEKTTQEVANGLSIVTAKYLASGGDVNELLAVDLGNSAAGVIEPMASGSGGTKTVSAIAVQYALAASFANSDAANGVTIEGKSVSEYLASAEDPIAAIDTVKNLDAYKNNYVSTDADSQYQKDINGFVGTMSILGNNIDNGTIDKNDYLSNGVGSTDAKDVLTGVLGK